MEIGILTRETLIRRGLISSGILSAYALGANNVANTAGIFAGGLEGVSNIELAFLGSISIGIGALLFSKPIMMNIGKRIVVLDGFSALVAVLSSGITVYIFH
jgi:PiT family inorganic phosphate transporter